MKSSFGSLILTGLIIIFLVANSCHSTMQDKLKGVWEANVKQKNLSGSDSIEWMQLLEFTNHNEILTYYKSSKSSEWQFTLSRFPTEDSMRLEKFNFAGKNCIVMHLDKSDVKYLGITDKILFRRTNIRIKLDQRIMDLCSDFAKWGKSLRIDSIDVGRVYYQYEMTLDGKTTYDSIEVRLETFFDRRIGSLPYLVKERQFSAKDNCYSSSYMWKNQKTEISMDCYFVDKDLTDRIKINDEDRVFLKILTDEK